MNAGEFAKRRAIIEREHARSRTYRRKAMAALLREAKAQTVTIDGKVVGWLLPSGQTVCRKRRYRSLEDAELALVAVQGCPKTIRIPTRTHACPHCKGWHLTSQNALH
jgi:hypothetical protein